MFRREQREYTAASLKYCKSEAPPETKLAASTRKRVGKEVLKSKQNLGSQQEN